MKISRIIRSSCIVATLGTTLLESLFAALGEFPLALVQQQQRAPGRAGLNLDSRQDCRGRIIAGLYISRSATQISTDEITSRRVVK